MSVLVIGSAVCDVSLYVDHLPDTEEDVNVLKQKLSLGGCACNVVNMLRLMDVNYQFASKAGTGPFAEYVRQEMKQRGMTPMFSAQKKNGACYTLVDPEGNRTFLAVHGAEYHFYEKELNQIDLSDTDLIYFCGLEIEEETGAEMLSFLEKHQDIPMFFAPGPRITKIPEDKMKRILAMHPSVHLNRREASSFLQESDLAKADLVTRLHQAGFDRVVLTDGDKPAEVFDQGRTYEVKTVMAQVIDGTGAGDSHIGTILGCLEKGMDLKEAVQTANLVSAAVTECEGPVLTDEKYEEIRKEMP